MRLSKLTTKKIKEILNYHQTTKKKKKKEKEKTLGIK